MDFSRSNELRPIAHRLIPGGAHTYAKGDDQYPQLSPSHIRRGSGCRVWDVDDNEFIEYGSGLRSIVLGHAHPEVVRAASAQMLLGANFVRPAEIEVRAAERVTSLIESAEMVKFGKHGSDATSAAVKLSRAATGRDHVAICDQPFFAVDDWFIGSTALSAGVPMVVRQLTHRFSYGDIESLRALFADHPAEIACVIMEAEKYEPPPPGYLHAVQDLCAREGALFILDESISGFRLDLGGAQRLHGLRPDLSTFGKAMANGFSVSALVGRRDVMDLGGIDHDRDRVFLLSTTHGAETHALAAAMATIDVIERDDVIDVLERQGGRLRAGVEQVASELGVADHLTVSGRSSNLIFSTLDASGAPSQQLRALFMQEMIARGVLAPSFVVNASHDDAAIDHTIEAVAGALSIFAKALDGGIEQFLVGGPTKPVFRRRA